MYRMDVETEQRIKDALELRATEKDRFAAILFSRLMSADSRLAQTEQALESRSNSVIDDLQRLVRDIRGENRYTSYHSPDSSMSSITEFAERAAQEAKYREELYQLASIYAGVKE